VRLIIKKHKRKGKQIDYGNYKPYKPWKALEKYKSCHMWDQEEPENHQCHDAGTIRLKEPDEHKITIYHPPWYSRINEYNWDEWND